MSELKEEKLFYDLLRQGKFLGPVLSTDEYNGTKAIVTACMKADWPISWTAYALATAYHETAHTMQPIKEYGGPKYFTRMYDIKGSRPSLAKANGNTQPGDGAKYFGRGYVQLTWKDNYDRAGDKLNLDLVNSPDKALDPEVASNIMVLGMGEGWFTSKSCKTYLPTKGTATLKQFVDSRRIINGTDKADLIATYAVHFQDALIAGKYT